MASPVVRLLLLGIVCALPCFGTSAEVVAQCHGGAQDSDSDPESDSQCLMQGGLRTARVARHESEDTCFRALLGVDPNAVPLNKESIVSHGLGLIKVTSQSVVASVSWRIPGVSSSNPVIGMHIHVGNCSANGAILVGFCGESPLPSFTGKCSQDIEVRDYEVDGQACDITGDGSPCVNAAGTATIEQAAAALATSPDPKGSFYLNVHTTFSFDKNGDQPLGLIRGQLEKVACA